MRQHVSVLMLFVRSTLYKLLLIVFVMAAAESVLFALALRSAEGYFGLDTILRASRPQSVCAVCFLLLCALMCLTGCEFGSKQGYTLARLRISHKMIFFWQIVNNAGLLLLFWAAQVGIVLAFCGVYTAQYPQPQAAVLVFYANGFLHSLLPLAETGRLICNMILLASLAVTSACFPVRMRRGEKPMAFFAVMLLCVPLFIRETGSVGADVTLSIIAIGLSAFAAYGAGKEVYDEALS